MKLDHLIVLLNTCLIFSENVKLILASFYTKCLNSSYLFIITAWCKVVLIKIDLNLDIIPLLINVHDFFSSYVHISNTCNENLFSKNPR